MYCEGKGKGVRSISLRIYHGRDVILPLLLSVLRQGKE